MKISQRPKVMTGSNKTQFMTHLHNSSAVFYSHAIFHIADISDLWFLFATCYSEACVYFIKGLLSLKSQGILCSCNIRPNTIGSYRARKPYGILVLFYISRKIFLPKASPSGHLESAVEHKY